MLTEAQLRQKIARNYEMPDPRMGFLADYRDLVIAIGDGDIEGDPQRLCRILATGEVRWTIGQPPKLTATPPEL